MIELKNKFAEELVTRFAIKGMDNVDVVHLIEHIESEFRSKIVKSLREVKEYHDRDAASCSMQFVKTGKEEDRNNARLYMAKSETIDSFIANIRNTSLT